MSAPVTPRLAADVIIELLDRQERPIVLIEREYPPLGFAIPGGFVDPGESAEQAAVREAAEETGLAVELRALLGVYSGPGRDPRGATASVVYVAAAHGEPRAMDDARAVHVVSAAALPGQLAFDHRQILDDYLHYRASGEVPRPRMCAR